MMQHYGTPTRLLDWTEVSPIALFFAVRNPKLGVNSVVWVMNPGWLNKLSMRFDIRIQVQLSCFTIHGYIEDGFKEMVKQENNSMIAKLIIESGSAPGKIKYDLGTMGIRESTLFPDPVGLSRELKEEYEV